jgi:hypothetical protein
MQKCRYNDTYHTITLDGKTLKMVKHPTIEDKPSILLVIHKIEYYVPTTNKVFKELGLIEKSRKQNYICRQIPERKIYT